MKTILGIKIGGLQQKIFNLVLLVIIAIIGAFIAVNAYQQNKLTQIVQSAGVEQQEDTTVCTFDYLVSGITVDLGTNAATVTFSGSSVRELRIRAMSFRLTGNALYPLPVAQAAAILPPDSDLLLQYRADSGSALDVGWMQ